MKIEIEVNATGNPTLTIDGKEMIIDLSDGTGCTLCGIKSPETENTPGGIVAAEIYSKIYDIRKALCKVTTLYAEGGDTWGEMSESAAEMLAEELF